MSLTYTSAEAYRKAQSARRNAALSTLAVTIFVCAAVFLALWFFLIEALKTEAPVITPVFVPESNTQVVEQELVKKPEPEPVSSSSAIAPKILTLNSIQNLAVPETQVTNQEMAFGSSTGIGNLGIGDLGIGGRGSGAQGVATLFNSPSSGERFAFVVDFSGSNRDDQREAIRSELSKVLNEMSGVQFQIIGFAGAVWFLGDEVIYNKAGNPIIVNGGQGRNYNLKWDHVDRFVWQPNSTTMNQGIPQGQWLGDSSRRSMAQIIQENSREKGYWIGGTNWSAALETALQMQPQPDVIYFLTDGNHNSGGNLLSIKEVAEIYGERIRSAGIEFNSIALVEDRAVEAMKELTAIARGKLFRAQTDGSSELIDDYSQMSAQEVEEALNTKGKRKREKN